MKVPFVTFLVAVGFVWVAETFLLSSVGLGHAGIGTLAFGLVLIFFATGLYLCVCMVTHWLTERLTRLKDRA